MEEDYRVRPLSDDDTEAIAAGWREVLVGAAPRFDIIAVIEKAGREFRLTKGLELVEKPDAEMGQLEAYVQWVNDLPRIFARTSITDWARKDDPRGISTLTHELMHVVLEHRRNDDVGALLPRLVTPNRRPKYIALYESAEHQTRVATAEFLMPRDEVRKLASLEQIAQRFGTSKEASRIRYKTVVEQSQPRDKPDSVKSYLRQRKPSVPAKTEHRRPYVPARLTDIDKVWEEAALAPDSEPSEYRLSQSGFLVKKADYLKTAKLGWFVHNNHIYAHRDAKAAEEAESELCTECGHLALRRDGLKLKCGRCGTRVQL